jgi:hypothetical protein
MTRDDEGRKAAELVLGGPMTDREVSLFLIGCSLGELIKASAELHKQVERVMPAASEVRAAVELLQAQVTIAVTAVRRELNP